MRTKKAIFLYHRYYFPTLHPYSVRDVASILQMRDDSLLLTLLEQIRLQEDRIFYSYIILEILIQQKRIASAQLVIADLGDPSLQDKGGNNLLHHACCDPQAELILFLLQAGVNPQTPNLYNCLSVFVLNHKQILYLKWFIEYGLDIGISNKMESLLSSVIRFFPIYKLPFPTVNDTVTYKNAYFELQEAYWQVDLAHRASLDNRAVINQKSFSWAGNNFKHAVHELIQSLDRFLQDDLALFDDFSRYTAPNFYPYHLFKQLLQEIRDTLGTLHSQKRLNIAAKQWNKNSILLLPISSEYNSDPKKIDRHAEGLILYQNICAHLSRGVSILPGTSGLSLFEWQALDKTILQKMSTLGYIPCKKNDWLEWIQKGLSLGPEPIYKLHKKSHPVGNCTWEAGKLFLLGVVWFATHRFLSQPGQKCSLFHIPLQFAESFYERFVSFSLNDGLERYMDWHKKNVDVPISKDLLFGFAAKKHHYLTVCKQVSLKVELADYCPKKVFNHLVECLNRLHFKQVSNILALGWDINTVVQGNTLLSEMARQGNVLAVEFLLGRQADVTIKTSTPLIQIALEQDNALLRQFILAQNPPLNARNDQEQTVLEVAILRDKFTLLWRLLAFTSIDLNQTFGSGQTALHLCVSVNNLIFIQYLLNHGANPKVCNRMGRTPLQEAEWVHNKQAKGLLLRHQGNHLRP